MGPRHLGTVKEGVSIHSCKEFMSTRLQFLSFKLPRTGNYQKPYVSIFPLPVPPTVHRESTGLGILVLIMKHSLKKKKKKASTCLLVVQQAIISELYWTCVYTFSSGAPSHTTPKQPRMPGQVSMFMKKNKWRIMKSRDWILVTVWTCQVLPEGLQGIASVQDIQPKAEPGFQANNLFCPIAISVSAEAFEESC